MFTLEQVAQICNGRLLSKSPKTQIRGFAIDHRHVAPGDLFVAIRGKRLDGHLFLPAAYERGAVGGLVDHEVTNLDDMILVSNPLRAFQQLAKIHRARFSMPVVGVTGSAGKTTTKECVGVALSRVFQMNMGFRNWNNHIGVPFNLLKLSEQDQCFVLELGANHPGEIAFLSELAQPTVGVITGIQRAHLSGFGSIEGVYRAKLELADYLVKRKGVVIANGDDPVLVKQLKQRGASVLTFGTQAECDVRMTQLIARDGTLYFRVNEDTEFRLKGYGSFNAYNALAAIAVAEYFKMDLADLSQGWCALPAIDGRFQCEMLESPDVQLVDDSYNANPQAFEHALTSFQDLAGNRRKMVVIGDMLELGDEAKRYHQELGRSLVDYGVEIVFGVGSAIQNALSAFTEASPKGVAFWCENVASAAEQLQSELRDGDAVLIKGSHSVGLHRLKDEFFELRTKPIATL